MSGFFGLRCSWSMFQFDRSCFLSEACCLWHWLRSQACHYGGRVRRVGGGSGIEGVAVSGGKWRGGTRFWGSLPTSTCPGAPGRYLRLRWCWAAAERPLEHILFFKLNISTSSTWVCSCVRKPEAEAAKYLCIYQAMKTDRRSIRWVQVQPS